MFASATRSPPPSSGGAAAARSTSGPRRARIRARARPLRPSTASGCSAAAARTRALRGRARRRATLTTRTGRASRAARGRASRDRGNGRAAPRRLRRRCASAGSPRAAARGDAARCLIEQCALLAERRAEALGGERQRARRGGQGRKTRQEHETHSPGIRQRLAERHADAPAAAVGQLCCERRRPQRCVRRVPAAPADDRSARPARAQAPGRRSPRGARVDSRSGISTRRGRGGSSSPQASLCASIPAAPKRSASEARASAASSPSVRDPQPLEGHHQWRRALARAQQGDRKRRQVRPRHPPRTIRRAPRARRQRGRQRAEARRRRRQPRRAIECAGAPRRGPARRCRRAGRAARRARSRRARGAAARRRRRSPRAYAASPSQAAATATGSAASSSSVGAAGERLAERHPAAHAEGLGGAGDLADRTAPARPSGAIATALPASASEPPGGDRELEAGIRTQATIRTYVRMFRRVDASAFGSSSRPLEAGAITA